MQEKLTRGRFIGLGTAMGAGAALVACGGGSGGGSGNVSGGGGSSSGGSSSGGAAAIASESEVAPGEAVKFEEGGQPAVLVHLDGGDFVAYSAVCTHQGCTVAYQPDSGELACPCHGSVYDPASSAEVISGPAPRPLAGIPVEVRNGEVVRA